MWRFEQTLTYLEFPRSLWSQIKTNNPLERYLEELERRIKPFCKFVNAKSVDRIIYGIVATSWITVRKKTNMLFYTINLTDL